MCMAFRSCLLSRPLAAASAKVRDITCLRQLRTPSFPRCRDVPPEWGIGVFGSLDGERHREQIAITVVASSRLSTQRSIDVGTGLVLPRNPQLRIRNRQLRRVREDMCECSARKYAASVSDRSKVAGINLASTRTPPASLAEGAIEMRAEMACARGLRAIKR